VRGRITRIGRDKRGLSPIFAVLILVAISVIAGIIVYMFTSGYLATMMGGGTTGQEKVAVESVEWDGTTLTVWAKSTGGGDVLIDAVIVRDASGNQIDIDNTVSVTLPSAGTLTAVVSTPTGLIAGDTYTAALVSKQGGQFVSPSFRG